MDMEQDFGYLTDLRTDDAGRVRTPDPMEPPMKFERTTHVPAPPDRVFELSLSVDAHSEAFSDSEESAVGGVTSGVMGEGDTVTWRARHFGIWWKMTSEIVEYDPPRCFVDQQRSGPFKRFRHEHHFAAASDGSTVMIDHVEFEAPLGVLGRIAEKVVLDRYMPRLIDQRNAHLIVAASELES